MSVIFPKFTSITSRPSFRWAGTNNDDSDIMETNVVIMAGGIGSRLWPLSTPEMPKQFIDLLGIGKTMIQLTVERFLPVCDPANFWVVTSADYVEIVREQLPSVPAEHILAEPEPRNTAPCIAYACWKISSVCPDANIVVTPADALILNEQRFANVIRKALNFTVGGNGIVTVGIEPTRPETGYGYIFAEKKLPEEVVKVREFKEKPDLATAKEYLAAGTYFWNAGIFVWNARTIVAQMRTHAPQIAGVMDRIAASFGTLGEEEAVRELFPTCEKISIDYAVMEKSDEVYVIEGDLGWSDLGSFSSVKAHIPAPEDDPVPDGCASDEVSEGNKAVGKDVRLFGCKDCIVHAEDAGTVIVKGLEGYIVAVKGGNVLVCPLADEQRIKEYSSK